MHVKKWYKKSSCLKSEALLQISDVMGHTEFYMLPLEHSNIKKSGYLVVLKGDIRAVNLTNFTIFVQCLFSNIHNYSWSKLVLFGRFNNELKYIHIQYIVHILTNSAICSATLCMCGYKTCSGVPCFITLFTRAYENDNKKRKRLFIPFLRVLW